MSARFWRNTWLVATAAAAVGAILFSVPRDFTVNHHHHAPPRKVHHYHKVKHWQERFLLVTAYAKHCCQCAFKSTATGTVPMAGTAAVDPSVFRFGTEFLVPGYGWAKARDTGGAIIGNHIDVVEKDCVTALNWGPRHLKVKVLIPM
jgi:3D (Asp-Asp-Asp) domain-containing protein